jgi:photosystem II stability/assembly factor-like uncharacterized protein
MTRTIRLLSLAAALAAAVIVGFARAMPPSGASLSGSSAQKPTPSALAMWTPTSGLVGLTSYHALRGSIWILSPGHHLHEVLRLNTPVDSLQTMGPHAALAEIGEEHHRYLRTTDGGHHWQAFRLRYRASFATAKLGLGYATYMAGNQEKMALYGTRDGGRTWQRQGTPCQGVAAITDLVTSRLAWLMCLGEPGAGNEEKALFRTTDGGAHWQPLAHVQMTRPAHGGIQSYGYPVGASFAPAGFGILWESRGTLYVTRDGGAHWTPKPKVARPEEDFGFGGAVFPGGRAFLLLAGGRPARLLETTNFGRTWHPIIRWR